MFVTDLQTISHYRSDYPRCPKKFAPVLLIPEDEQDNLMKIDDVEFRVTP